MPDDPRAAGRVRVCGMTQPTATVHGATYNSAYSHVLCHAEVRKWKRLTRVFMALCLFADVVLLLFMVNP